MSPSDQSFLFDVAALIGMHEACETYLVKFFQAARECAEHAGRDTVTKADFALAMTLSAKK